MSDSIVRPERLGAFLRDRRRRLDPASFGFAGGRRRTAGLRREEVAQRAGLSATWYTWLEQGRGGAPSAAALERISKALMLNEAEREHLFILGLGRPPEIRAPRAEDAVTPRLQRLLDGLTLSPAMVRTACWDVLAWNRAAAVVLTDYGQLPPQRRNVLRQIFFDPRVQAAQLDWHSVARFVVAAFRADVARAGMDEKVAALVAELSASPEFAALWAKTDVRHYGEGTKKIVHPMAGLLSFEYSAFAVDARPDLGLVIYTPASAADADLVRALLDQNA